MYKHIWQVQKGKTKNKLGKPLIFDLTTLHFDKYMNLSHSAKCSVSTQLTYIQKIQYNKVSISTTRTGFEINENNFSILKTDNFANFMILAILDFLDFLDILPLCFFLLLLVPLCKFYKTNTDFEKLWFLPET